MSRTPSSNPRVGNNIQAVTEAALLAYVAAHGAIGPHTASATLTHVFGVVLRRIIEGNTTISIAMGLDPIPTTPSTIRTPEPGRRIHIEEVLTPVTGPSVPTPSVPKPPQLLFGAVGNTSIGRRPAFIVVCGSRSATYHCKDATVTPGSRFCGTAARLQPPYHVSLATLLAATPSAHPCKVCFPDHWRALEQQRQQTWQAAHDALVRGYSRRPAPVQLAITDWPVAAAASGAGRTSTSSSSACHKRSRATAGLPDGDNSESD